MSSTNRGGKREPSDYYVTPVHHIEAFLKAWYADVGPDVFGSIRTILDPCAGGTQVLPDGQMGEGMSYPMAIRHCEELFPNLKFIETADIRNDSRANIICDYRATAMPMKFNLIITNPPFCYAEDIINKALTELDSDLNFGAFVVMLLRLNFLGGQDRREFLQRHPPQFIYVHSERMGFRSHLTDDQHPEFCAWLAKQQAKKPKLDRQRAFNEWRKQTDSIEYCHMVWWNAHPIGGRLHSSLRVI